MRTFRLMLLAFFLVLAAAPLRADFLAVANRGGTTITVIDPATFKILGTVTVGNDPHEVAIGADGLAYVSNYGGATGTTLSVVDLAKLQKLKDVSIAPLTGPHGILSVGGKIWFTAEKSQSVGRYDPVADRVDWVGHTNQNGSHMMAVHPGGSVAYTGNIGDSTASIIPVSGAESTSKVNVPVVAQPEGIAISPDGREVWLGSRAFQGISVIDVATEKVVATVAAGTFAYRLTFTPDGKHVLVPRQGEIAVIDAAQRTQVRTIPYPGSPFSVVTSPDGRTLYVAGGNPHQVLKIEFATGKILGTLAMSGPPDGLAYATPKGPKRRSVTKGE